MERNDQRDILIARAKRTQAIMTEGTFSCDGTSVDIGEMLIAARQGTRLVVPDDWDGILDQATRLCTRTTPAPIMVRQETTLAALERLAPMRAEGLAALNFASARRPGGGWDSGATAQEETLARASGLIACLAEAPDYYQSNRRHEHLFYTDHAIWSPQVPFFARDDGSLIKHPYTAGIITMPAPNVGGMNRLEASDLHILPGLWRRRIRCVLALAIVHQVKHLVLGAWGCGAFGNDPILVARWFREVLAPSESWLRGLESVTFAIVDTSRRKSCLAAFTEAFLPHDPSTPRDGPPPSDRITAP